MKVSAEVILAMERQLDANTCKFMQSKVNQLWNLGGWGQVHYQDGDLLSGIRVGVDAGNLAAADLAHCLD